MMRNIHFAMDHQHHMKHSKGFGGRMKTNSQVTRGQNQHAGFLRATGKVIEALEPRHFFSGSPVPDAIAPSVDPQDTAFDPDIITVNNQQIRAVSGEWIVTFNDANTISRHSPDRNMAEIDSSDNSLSRSPILSSAELNDRFGADKQRIVSANYLGDPDFAKIVFDKSVTPDEAVALLAKNPAVLSFEPNYVGELAGMTVNDGYTNPASPSFAQS